MFKVNGDVYSGAWVDDKFSGFGHGTYRTGGCFYGFWVDSKRHGCGLFEWPDGVKFYREYNDDSLLSERPVTEMPREIADRVAALNNELSRLDIKV